jgi:ubiquinol-cytochrome c reductase cytochrome b subunit
MKFKLYSSFKNHLINYPTPLNLNINWCFGSAAGCFLALQIVTGLLLAAQYVSESKLSFENIEYIMREVNFGWVLRYLHANGASFFFILIYFHILKAIFYKSYCYPRQFVWFSGVIILFLSIITAFMGYVLP